MMARCKYLLSGWPLASVAMLGILASAARVCRADDAADARQTAKDFVQAVARGDNAGAKSYLTQEAAAGQAGRFVDALVGMLSGRDRFDQASTAKFGEQAHLRKVDPTGQMIKQLEKADANVNGDTVTLSHPNDPNPIKLQKISGTWKIIEVGAAKELQRTTPLLEAMAKAEDETAREISDGKYQSFDQARQALNDKMQALAPTTAPGNPGGAH